MTPTLGTRRTVTLTVIAFVVTLFAPLLASSTTPTAHAATPRPWYTTSPLRESRDVPSGSTDVAIDIALAHTLRRGTQQRQRIRAFEGRVGVGEMAADVAKAGGTEQGIDDRVQQRIRIRMPQQPAVVGNLDPAQQQLAAGHQRVGVPPLANSQGRQLHQRERPRSTASAMAKSSG